MGSQAHSQVEAKIIHGWGLPQTIINPFNDPLTLPTRYIFLNIQRESWVKAGKKHSVVLKPMVERIDETEDLMLVQKELQV